MGDPSKLSKHAFNSYTLTATPYAVCSLHMLSSYILNSSSGHKNLWDNNILHRDISVNNILLSLDPVKENNRGLIIDLDLAILINRTKSLAGIDFKTVQWISTKTLRIF